MEESQNAISLGEKNFKRWIAYKFRIGDIISGKTILEGDRVRALEINGKQVGRVNIIANVVDKYVQEGEKKYGTLTLDDASGQVRVKFFRDDVEKLNEFNQGDTVMVIGLIRSWNNELYLTPEIIKKKDSDYLLVRKLELELEKPKVLDKEKMAELKDKIILMVKEADGIGGIDVDKIIMELKESPEIINQEIRRLLEEGIAYEPRPGKLRFLG
ncbi:OB-fold nucleic acid binding domain-containing protein [Candidatus Pacearchaeota archaeon]|nr:OB-fold nucleic acid binding domain-containing protein [Candidatus Pacearchaeota archaeon]